MSTTFRRCALALMTCTLLLPTGSSAEDAFDVGDVADYLGFDEATGQRLLAGEIVSASIAKGKEKTELALAVAMRVPISLESGYRFVASGDVLRADRNLLGFRELSASPPSEAEFANVGFSPQETGEAGKLLGFRGGGAFNLSADEIAGFEALPPESDPAAVSDRYRQVLFERYRAYRERGLAGIAPYARGGGVQVEPGHTLALAAEAATFFREHLPALYAAFRDYPKDAAGAEHRFYWLKQTVQDRPTYVLSHRMLVKRAGFVAQAERQYFIGHSYNTVQIVSGALPVEGGVAVFYTNRTSIDQLAGMTGRIARPIATSRLIERVTQRFETLRSQAR